MKWFEKMKGICSLGGRDNFVGFQKAGMQNGCIELLVQGGYYSRQTVGAAVNE